MVTSELTTEQQTQIAVTDDREMLTVHESIFWEEDDPRWDLLGSEGVAPNKSNDVTQMIDLSEDSFIFVFTGVRGGGKSVTMTLTAMKCQYLWNMRVIANYPIEYRILYMDGSTRVIRSEPIDFYKLFYFDEDYQNCLIIIDEAPDIISHLSFMSLKNRLLNTWTRQLRKNRNSLMLGAQFFNLIDASFRQQCDIEVHCEDVRKKYRNPNYMRGEIIELTLKDCSGQWTGHTWKEEEAYKRAHNDYSEVGEKAFLYPMVIWGDEDQKPAYDTHFKQDVMESLRKVELHLRAIKIEDSDDSEGNILIEASANYLQTLKENEESRIDSMALWRAIEVKLERKLTPAERTEVGGRMSYAGVTRTGMGGKFYKLDNLDMEKFLK